jgi:transposase
MTIPAFLIYIEQLLVPSPYIDKTVIMNKFSTKNLPVVRSATEFVGARLYFIPAYCPDFNPIELAFSKLKAALRKAAHEPSQHRGGQFWRPSTVLRHKNARATSPPHAMNRMETNLL